MRLYFLELLACPVCKTPRLLHYAIEKREVEVRAEVKDLRCREWCGLHDKPASEVPISECEKCVRVEVEEGVLVCRSCGRWYPVIDGIPRLIDDKYRREREDKEFLEKNLERIPETVKKYMRLPPLPK